MQQPKKKISTGLSEQDNSILIKELENYANEGATDDQLREFKNTFISAKKKSIAKTASPSTSAGTKSASQSGTASSGTPRTIDNYITRQENGLSLPRVEKATKPRDEKLNAEIDSQYPVGSIAWSQEKLKANVPNYTSIYDDFKKTEAVDDNEKQRIVQEVEADADNSGVFNTLKSAAGKIINPIYRAFTEWEAPKEGQKRPELINSDPLEKEKAEAKKLLQQQVLAAKSQKKPVPEITPEAITQKAKEIAIDKRVKSQSDSQVRELLKSYESSNPDKQDALLRYTALEKASLTEKDKLLVGKQNILRSEIDNSLSTLKEYNSQIKELSSKGVPVPDDLKASYENEASKYQSLLNDAISSQNEYISNAKNLGELKDNLDVFKRDYGWMNNFIGNIDATIGDLSSGLAGAIDYGLNAKSKILNSPLSDAMDAPFRALAKGVSKDLKDDADETRSGLMKPISVEDINTPSDFGTWFSNTVLANQVPIFAMVATGAPGIASLGASATGQKFEEMQGEATDYSTAQQIGIPFGFGATETASAMVDRMLLGNASRVIRSATAPERKLIADGFWKGIYETAGNIAKGGIYEGIDESGTQIAQNIIDKYAGDKKNVEIFDNVKDAGYAGAVMGMMIPFSSSVVAEALNPFNTDNRIQKATDQLVNLEAQLANPDITEESRNIISKQVEKAKSNVESLLKTKVKEIEGLSDSQFQEIIKLEKKQSGLRSQAREIQLDDSLDQATKDQVTKELKAEFDGNEQRRIDLIERGGNVSLSTLEEDELIKLQDKATKELMREKNPDGTRNVTITEQEINRRAGQILNNQIRENERDQSRAETAQNNEEAPVIADKNASDQQVEIIDETAQNNDSPSDGNSQLRVTVVEENTNAGQQDTPAEDIPAASDAGPSESITKIKLSDKGGDFDVTFNNGALDIRDKSGNEPSAPTRRKIEEKYSETIDFTKGDIAPATDESVEPNKYIADRSNNPAEVAEALLSLDNQSIREGADYKKSVISENIGKVNRQSFIDNSDANNIGASLAKSYFSNDGSSLDTLAQEMSEIANLEITEQDIVDFILENPNGSQSYENRLKREAREPLQKRFTELTGLPANDKYLQKAIEQKNFIDNFATSFDYISDEALLRILNDYQQFENTANETDTRTEDSNRARNSEENSNKSGIQETRRGNAESERTGIPDRSSQEQLRSSDEIYRPEQDIRNRLESRVREAEKELKRQLSRQEIEDLERKVVLEHAKQNNTWIKDFYSLGTRKMQGGNENTLILDEENRQIFKSNNLINNNNSILDLLDAVQIHNRIFPETKYEIVGFTGIDNGTTRTPYIEVVLRQDYVPNTEQASQQEIESYMTSLGFEQNTEKPYSYTNGQFIVSDLRPRNVLKDENGNIYVIDDIVSENKIIPELDQEGEINAQGIAGSQGNQRDLTLSESGAVRDLARVQRKFKRLWNQTFKSNAGLDNRVGEVVRSKNRDVAAFTDAMNYEANLFKNLLSEVKKKNRDNFNDKLLAINDYLSGQNPDVSFLTEEQKSQLDYFRTRIDLLSEKIITILETKLDDIKTRQENAKNALAKSSIREAIQRTESLIKTIKENKASYLNRTYQIFVDDNYANIITQKADEINSAGLTKINNAVDFLVKEEGYSKEDAEQYVAEYLDAIKRSRNDINFIQTAKANAPFLKKRKDIPLAFRELLGESKDPIFNFVNTTYKLSSYIANLEYQSRLRDILTETGLGKTNPEQGYTKLTADGDGWQTLSDMYVPNELKESLDDMAPLKQVDSGFYKAWIKLAAFTKIGKTIASPTTTMRNIISGVFLGANSGHFFLTNPKFTAEAFNQAWNTPKSFTQLKAEREKLIKLGVLGDGGNSGELMAIVNDFSRETSRMISQNKFLYAFGILKKIYAFGDDFYKVTGFYIEKGRLMNAGVSDAEAETMAAERIRNSYPTYSYLPRTFQRLRRIPIAGTFVSFPYEMVRTTKNNLNYIREDLKEGRKKLAFQRAAGMIVANASLPALSAFTLNMIGFDDEDDDALRDMLPEWQKNSKLIYTGTKDGKPTFIDGTALFPSEVVMRPLSIILEDRAGRTIDDKIDIAVNDFLSPYISQDISFKTVIQLINNRDQYNEKIYKGDDIASGFANDADQIINFYLKQAGPGVYNNITEFLRANEIAPDFFGDKYASFGKEYTNKEALLGLLGFRLSTINYNSGITSFGYKTKDALDFDRSEVIKSLKTSKELTEKEVKDISKKYFDANKEANAQLINIVSGGKKLGMSEKDIKDALVRSGYSKADAGQLSKQDIPKLKKLAEQSKNKYMEKLEVNYGKIKSADLKKSFKKNLRLFDTEINRLNSEILKENQAKEED